MMRDLSFNSQAFQRRFDIWELDEDSLVGDSLVIEHQTDGPDGGAEADTLGAGQVIENDVFLILRGHYVLVLCLRGKNVTL